MLKIIIRLFILLGQQILILKNYIHKPWPEPKPGQAKPRPEIFQATGRLSQAKALAFRPSQAGTSLSRAGALVYFPYIR